MPEGLVPETPPRPPTGVRSLLIVTVLSLAATAGAVLWLFPAESQAALGRLGLGDAATRLAAQAVELTASTLGRMTGSSATRRDITLEAPTKPAPPVSAAAAARRTAPADAVEGAPLPNVEVAAAVTPVAATESPQPFEAPVDPRVYTMLDVTVVPPRPLYSLFPADPSDGTNPAEMGLVEFVVDEEGYVQVVNLIEPGTVIDSMMLAAIKAWRFQPALREGRPVKYRAAVRLTR